VNSLPLSSVMARGLPRVAVARLKARVTEVAERPRATSMTTDSRLGYLTPNEFKAGLPPRTATRRSAHLGEALLN
jgi:hypothetical protein